MSGSQTITVKALLQTMDCLSYLIDGESKQKPLKASLPAGDRPVDKRVCAEIDGRDCANIAMESGKDKIPLANGGPAERSTSPTHSLHTLTRTLLRWGPDNHLAALLHAKKCISKDSTNRDAKQASLHTRASPSGLGMNLC